MRTESFIASGPISQKDLEDIYEQHFERLYRFFYSRVLDRSIAEDLTSETFLSFVERCKKSQIDDPIKYLFGIARNVFFKYLRRKYKEAACVSLDRLEIDFGYSVVQQVKQYEEKQTLEERVAVLLEQLPEKQRLVLDMRLLQKMSPAQIAGALGKDMNYVKTTQKRALKSLKKLIACTPWVT